MVQKKFYGLVFLFCLAQTIVGQDDWEKSLTHGYAFHDSVKIHYVTIGEGPLLIMVHGFPDFWFSWRNQMPSLASQFKVVAIDQRGYNQSDKPKGVASYAIPLLVGDVVAVMDHFNTEEAIVVGHDWGGAVAWATAMFHPGRVSRLIICNLPHPKGMTRELANNPEQQKNSAYARFFQQPDAHKSLTPEGLAKWVSDTVYRKKYIEAFKRSDIEAMLNYYKANYPREPYSANTLPMPDIQCPVLMIHGLDDEALLPGGLNDTWEWLDKDLTLVTIPGAGHFVQHDAADLVTRSMLMWLNR